MVSKYFTVVRRNWSEIWPDKSFRYQLFVIPFCFLGFSLFFPSFFDYIEARDGPMLRDFILYRIPPRNVSVFLFFILYTGIGIALVYHIAHPRLFLIVLETYCMVTAMRILSIYLLPLHPPDGYMPLGEPVAQLFARDHKIISKDLFFSGHVATILSLYFPIRNKSLRTMILCFAMGVGLLVLIQHVHYTIDVLAAPVVTYVCYFVARKLTASIKLTPLNEVSTNYVPDKRELREVL